MSVLRELSTAEAAKLLDAGATAVDLRDAVPFGERHLAGSVHIKAKSPDFVPRVLRFTPGNAPLLLIADCKADADWTETEIADKRSVAGYVVGIEPFEGTGPALGRLPALTPAELIARMKQRETLHILDVREPDEWEQGLIAGAICIPMNDVLDKVGELPRHAPVAITCAGGQRSSLIASQLLTLGFTQLFNVTGGMKAWTAQSLPVEKKS